MFRASRLAFFASLLLVMTVWCGPAEAQNYTWSGFVDGSEQQVLVCDNWDTGGDCIGTEYDADSGTVSITAGGQTVTANYDGRSTAQSVAQDLCAAMYSTFPIQCTSQSGTTISGGAQPNSAPGLSSSCASNFTSDANGNAVGPSFCVTVGGGISGFINPKYIVVGVSYAPPGATSSVVYTNTTSVGNTTNISHSFTSDTGFSISISNGAAVPAADILNGSVKLTFSESTDYTIGTNSSQTVTVSKASTISYTTPGTPTFSPVNSDYDYIWLWINPEILVTYMPAGQNPASLQLTGYAFDPTDPVSGEPPPSGPYNGGPDIVQVQVGCLNGDFSCPSTLTITNGVVTSGTLARSWADNEYTWPAGEGPGLTTSDIANILTFDPLVPSNNYTLLSSFPTTTSDGRFSKEGYPPNPIQYPVGGGSESYSTVQMDTHATGSGTTNTTKQAFGVSEELGGDFLGIWTSTTTMTESETLTWNYSFLNTLTTTTTLTDALTVQGPPDPPPSYNGPTQFILYQDNMFGTFAFVPVNP